MTVELRSVSLLDGFVERFVASALTISEVQTVSQLTLRVDPDRSSAAALENRLARPLPGPGRFVSDAEQTVVWLGPDEWLLLGSGAEADLRDLVRPDGGAVVDVSAQRTTIEIAGPYAREVLAKGCATDLHPRVARPGLAVATLFAHVPTLILIMENDDGNDDGGAGEIRAQLIIRTTFVRHLAEWLLDAASEYAVLD